MPADFEQFIKERIYLHNVSERTVEWYRQSFAWLSRFPLTEDGAKAFVIGMRQAGLSPISCNSRIRVANAYFKWAGLPLKISRLKEEQQALPTFSDKQVQHLLRWKPKGYTKQRLHALVATLLDTGVRIEEALGITRGDTNLDDLLIRVFGKGRKARLVPMSFELRKVLFRFLSTHEHELVFCTHDGGRLGRRDMLRDLKKLCKVLGFSPPRRTLHAVRHTFAYNYIRRGGSQFHLMKILGHTSLEMTKKYVNLQTEDLQVVHSKLSLLCR